MLIRAIKVYFESKRQKKRLQKYINHEILEVLASICLYLDTDGRRTHNIGAKSMYGHFTVLKEYSDFLRKEIIAEEKNANKKKRGENETTRSNRSSI